MLEKNIRAATQAREKHVFIFAISIDYFMSILKETVIVQVKISRERRKKWRSSKLPFLIILGVYLKTLYFIYRSLF